MSVREIVGRLTDAKNKLTQAKAAGTAVAMTVSEAKAPVDNALDGVQDKSLGDDIAKHAQAISAEIAGIDGLLKGIDTTIQRAQGIGTQRR